MQTQSAKIISRAEDAEALDFRHVRRSIAYADMHIIRYELAEFLQLKEVPKEYIGHLLLAMTEILSNLVKHPPQKADYVEIRAHVAAMQVSLEVLDNSTPFANFNAKCETALSMLHTPVIRAESGYGLGCILALYKNPVYIPMNASPDHLNHFKISYDPTLTAGKPQPKRKIFLIDDDPISLQIHRQMLGADYDVISFERAEDALVSFARYEPELIISDLFMPGMDGIALRKALTGMDGGNTIPFIFLSGHCDNQNSPSINRLGVDDFLCKPVSKEHLRSVLARLLHRSQQVRAGVQGKFHHDITELLKPTLPGSYGSWTFITRTAAADAGGGDFILHQQTAENLMAVLADVMGHGRQAKFFSCVYAGYLRSMFRMSATTLDAACFLKHLSHSIAGDPLLESMIMTCQCFQFFPDGLLKVASAGHPCPILLRRQGATLMDVAGPLPGLVGDSVYDMRSVRMAYGDKVLFMTDGFLETFDRRGRAAQELLKKVQDTSALSAEDLADSLWKDFQHRQQTSNKDDATIIIAEYGRAI